MPDVPAPRILADKYLVGPLLGRGAVGEVYLARHRLTGAEVALKVIPSRLIGSEPSLQRFHREVSVANRIGHPGMVKVHDAGWSETDDAYYLAMERLSGQSLGAWAEGPEVDLRSAVQVVRAMLEPLAAAHAAGIVHRDLKPENVFLHHDPHSGARIVKLLDFGIARDQRELQSATLADMTLGTPAYMSPEQATSAKDATPASDVWSVGVMLYWLYSGRVPFEQETVFNTLTAICTQPHPPLTGQTPADLALIGLIEACLLKDPAARPRDAAAVAVALDSWLDGVGSEPVAPRPRADTEVRPFGGAEAIQGLTMLEAPHRQRLRALAMVVGVALLLAMGWWALPESSRSGDGAPAANLSPAPSSAPVSPAATALDPSPPRPESEPGPGPSPGASRPEVEPRAPEASRRSQRRAAKPQPMRDLGPSDKPNQEAVENAASEAGGARAPDPAPQPEAPLAASAEESPVEAAEAPPAEAKKSPAETPRPPAPAPVPRQKPPAPKPFVTF